MTTVVTEGFEDALHEVNRLIGLALAAEKLLNGMDLSSEQNRDAAHALEATLNTITDTLRGLQSKLDVA